LADYAAALAMANDRQLAGKPTEALDRALQLDPKIKKPSTWPAVLPIRQATIKRRSTTGKSF